MKKACAALMLAAVCLPGFSKEVCAEEHTWTLDADFDEGTIVNLNHDPIHDQLQLNDFAKPFRYINVAASARGTVVRVDTDTGEIVGEYRSVPQGRQYNPSRTSVDLRGNVWAGNRVTEENNSGSAVKIGIVVGGTRCNADGADNPNGEYVRLDPDKLTYNTCVDRDGDGLIRTSKGLGDILPWPDITDGTGGADGIVQDAEDECILIYQLLPDAPIIRHVSVDKGQGDGDGDVWLGGYPDEPAMFHKLDGETGAFVESFDARTFGCGGYGGLVSNGILWSASLYDNALLRYDLSNGTGQCIDVLHSYGLCADNDGFIWNVMREIDSITKINPNTGDYVSGFPVLTGGEYPRGVAVTPEDNNIWSANSNEPEYKENGASGTVSRLDADGNILAVIPVGKVPTGVAVDYRGKVWVTNRLSDDIMRIDPATNTVDLTVPLGDGAGPYNYSDMTGIVLLGHPPIGFWDVVYDGGCNTLWDRISWTGDEDAIHNGEIIVQVRAATSKAGLASVPFTTVNNGEALTGTKGQFMEVRTTLTTEAPVGERGLPVLRDLTLESSPLTLTVDTIPDQKYNYGFQSINLDDYITFDPEGDYYDQVIWTYSDLPEGWSVTIDDNRVATVTCPEDETEDASIIFSAEFSWGTDECAVNAPPVLFRANHPPVLCDTDASKCLRQNSKKWMEVPLTGFVCDPDGDPITVEITSITSDEPTQKNNGDPAPDAQKECIGTDTAILRAQRDGGSDGRVYVVNFTARDGRGGEAELSLPVRVPHDQNGECEAVDSGQKYDATEESPEGGKKKKK